MGKKIYVMLLVWMGFLLQVKAQQSILLTNSNLRYEGLFHTVIQDHKVQFNRHLPAMIDNWESGIGGSWINQWVVTQTGVRVRIKTDSPNIKLVFSKRTGGGSVGNAPSSGFNVFHNQINIKTTSDLKFTVTHPNPGTSEEFMISLPNLWAVDLDSIFIDDNYTLSEPSADNRPVYVSFGNSITHGTGQYVNSTKTYPWILAEKMNWNLHNLAVAGSTLGWAIALNIKNKQVDYITLKIGYNDWKYTSKSLQDRSYEYGRLLDTLRAHHSTATIYCITPLYTSDVSGAASYSIEQYRNAIRQVISDRQENDDKICIVEGLDVSDASVLASGDPVHLSEYGANYVATKLSEKLNTCSKAEVRTDIEKKSEEQIWSEIKFNQEELSIEFTVSKNYRIELYQTDGKKVFGQMHTPQISERFLLKEKATISSQKVFVLYITDENSGMTYRKLFFAPF